MINWLLSTGPPESPLRQVCVGKKKKTKLLPHGQGVKMRMGGRIRVRRRERKKGKERGVPLALLRHIQRSKVPHTRLCVLKVVSTWGS